VRQKNCRSTLQVPRQKDYRVRSYHTPRVSASTNFRPSSGRPPVVALIDGESIPPKIWQGVEYLVGEVESAKSPGLIVEINDPLARHPCALLAAMLGLIAVAGSTDGRFYILQPATATEARAA
jgi:hypothetical protein